MVFALLVVACGEPLATPELVYLRTAGSTSMGPLVEDLVDAFEARSSRTELEVASLGTQYGLDTLRAGEADLAFASWLVPAQKAVGEGESEERLAFPAGLVADSDWRASAIARDGIAIIVHPSNPLEGVGLLQLRDLFSGRAHEWLAVHGESSLGEVQPVSREAGSGTRAAFEVLVMEDTAVTPRAVVIPSPQGVVDFVAEHRGAVGYVSSALVTPQVKALEIEGEAPVLESFGLGVYPLTRELWLIIRADAPAEAGEFVDFCLSPAGQQIVGGRYGRVR
jgi:phosphate transport system substrate-binding protein